MKKNIDINCDIGEGLGQTHDALLMSKISSCNIACGFHAGDPLIMSETIKLALENGVKIGAHPAYLDLQNFGRRSMSMSEQELEAILNYQISALKGMVESQKGTLHHVKLHGALYHDAIKNPKIAEIFCSVVMNINSSLMIYGQPNSHHQFQAEKYDLPFVAEAFGDRKYSYKGNLASRLIPNSVMTSVEDITYQVLSIINQGKVKTLEGEKLAIRADTICIHSDTPKAYDILNTLQQTLKSHKINIVSV